MRTKEEQISWIRADQQFWRDLAREVGRDRYAELGPMGEWSFGDMAAHLVAWRDWTITRLEAGVRGESNPTPPWPPEMDEEDVDAINTWIQEHRGDRSPEQFVQDYDDSYDRLIAAIEALPEATLLDPDAAPWIGGPLVEVLFTGHLHDEHVPVVRAWLEGERSR